VLERIRGNLFFIPMLFVVGGAVLGLAGVRIDGAFGDGGAQPFFVVESTVDSARAVLGAIAGATVTVAGIAFSIALLVFQLASSEYSPRVIDGLFRDEFNKLVMGLVVGTFTYCLVVLQAVRGPLDDDGSARIPSMSVTVGVILGVLSVLAIVAFIDHNARMMNASQILHRITESTRARADRTWTSRTDEEGRPARIPVGASSAEEARASDPARGGDAPDEPGHSIRLDRDGWIQAIDTDELLGVFAPGSTVRLETWVGRYSIETTDLCTVWPAPTEDRAEEIAARANRAVRIGTARTLTQDVPYGVRQLVDVSLRALSPSTNDPTTAQDAIFHLVAVLSHLFRSDPPQTDLHDDHGRHLIAPEAISHTELVDLAFDEIRVSAATHPTVCIYLLEALHLLDQGEDLPLGVPARLRYQAAAVVDGCAAADVLPTDLQRVRSAHAQRFGDDR
jgi:uncharacterized membrane protein